LDLERFILQDYIPGESESPCQSLDQLHGFRLSVPTTEAVELTDPIAIYQALDVCVGTNKPYKCHLKDKARFKSLANNPNNILAASWPLHQMLDGLNNKDDMSVVKLSLVSASQNTIASKENRYAATVQLKFLHEADSQAFQATAGAQRVDKCTWRTIVHVRNAWEFAEFVKWKGQDTQSQWDAYNAAVSNM
jgi:hypothetical protein